MLESRTAGRQRHSFVRGHPEWIRSGAKWSPTTCFCQPQNFSSTQKFLNFSLAFEFAALFLHNVCDKLGGFSAALTQIFQLLLMAQRYFRKRMWQILKTVFKLHCQVYKYALQIPWYVQHLLHKSFPLWSPQSKNIKLKSIKDVIKIRVSVH